MDDLWISHFSERMVPQELWLTGWLLDSLLVSTLIESNPIPINFLDHQFSVEYYRIFKLRGTNTKPASEVTTLFIMSAAIRRENLEPGKVATLFLMSSQSISLSDLENTFYSSFWIVKASLNMDYFSSAWQLFHQVLVFSKYFLWICITHTCYFCRDQPPYQHIIYPRSLSKSPQCK